MSCLQKILVSGRVTPLMKGRMARLLVFSGGAAYLKKHANQFSWCRDGMCGGFGKFALGRKTVKAKIISWY